MGFSNMRFHCFNRRKQLLFFEGYDLLLLVKILVFIGFDLAGALPCVRDADT